MFNVNNLANSFVLDTIFGVVLAVIAFILVYGASMALYFKIRRKHAYSKFGVEVGIMALVLLISFASRFLLFFNIGMEDGIYEGNGILETMGTALRAAYSSIGQLTFEGLDDYVPSNIPIGYWMFYWGTAVYCAVMFLSLITTKVSYETYSRLGVSKVARSGNDVDLFIFKNATEDTVALAESIENHYSNELAEYEKNKDKLVEDYLGFKKSGGADNKSYSQLKKEQKKADDIRLKLNLLTERYVSAWYLWLKTKFNVPETSQDFICGFLLPSLLWAALVKNNESLSSCELISRRTFIDFYADDVQLYSSINAIDDGDIGETSLLKKYFDKAFTVFKDTANLSDAKLSDLTGKFELENNSSYNLISVDTKELVISFPTEDITFNDSNGRSKKINLNELLKEILSLSARYASITENLISSISRDIYSSMINCQKPRSCRILFLGNELEPFDGDNPLHREIMAHDYYYVSYVRNEKSPVSVFKRFKLAPANDFLDKICEYKRTRSVHVFSFGLSEDLTGDEASNGADVFEEIKLLFTECVKKNAVLPDLPIVSYYLLSDNEVNYQTYENKLYDILREIIERYHVRMTAEEAMLHFQLNVINEAALSAKSLIKKRFATFTPDSGYSAVDESIPFSLNDYKDNNEYRVAVLGFGQTGQAAMKELFVNTSYVGTASEKEDERLIVPVEDGYDVQGTPLKLIGGEPTQFIADVFDSKIDELIGLFAFKNPLFICANETKENIVRDFNDTSDYCLSNILRMYSCKPTDITAARNLREGVGFPILFLHNASCMGMDFLQKLDRWTGIESNELEKDNSRCRGICRSPYKAFIIALGDDEANISIANALIDDIKRESVKFNRIINHQTIYVNIRDERNYSRLNSGVTKGSKQLLTVIPFGSRTDIYSYDYVVDSSEIIKYNTSYNYLSNEMDRDFIKKYAISYNANVKDGDAETTCRISFLDTRHGESDSLISALINLSDKVKTKYTTYGNVRNWLKLSLFLRQSNLSSYDFGEFFRQYIKMKKHVTDEVKLSELSPSDILKLTDIEHTRWDRFHIAQGWTYSKKKNKTLKEHNCIVPFSSLYNNNPAMLLYDLGNIIVDCNCGKH